MLPTTIFKVKELREDINVLKSEFATDNLDSIVLTDNAILGITATRHLCLSYDAPDVNEPLYINSTVIDELTNTDSAYIGFEDGLNYEFYDSEDDIPTPCI